MKLFLFFLTFSLYALDTASSYPYLSGYSWLHFSDWRLTLPDFGRDYGESFDPKKVGRGDTLFVEMRCLEEFAKNYLPEIKEPIILITSNYGYRADEPVPGPFDFILNEEKVAFWLVQNIDRPPTEKLIPIPIGITSKCFPIGDTDLLDYWISSPKEKNHFLYLNFALDINRMTCYHHFLTLGVKMEKRKPFDAYLKDLSESIFVVSPPGNGLDCHRTWEALLLGCYPIVLSSTLNPLYRDLPVAIVEDWEEVTEEFLKQKYQEFIGESFSREKLYAPYWFDLVRKLQTQLRS